MAARLNPRTCQQVREKIQVGQLIKVVENAALGKRKTKITPLQLDAAKYLLNQAIGMAPQANDVTINGQIAHNDISDKPISAEQWARQAADTDSLGATAGAAEAIN